MDGDPDHGPDALGGRSHFRVCTRIPLIYETIDESERPALAQQLLAVLDPPPIDVDPGLVAWLDRIERKLDSVLGALEVERTPLLNLEDARTVLLSGSGLSFDTSHEIEPGRYLLLSFELPADRVRLVRCLGKVVHCSRQEDTTAWTLGVGFDTIRPSDEDAVVQYTVDVQRQQIRASNTDNGGGG